MSDRLQWIFELIDKVSGPGKSMAQAVDAVDKAMGGAASGTTKAEEAFRKAGGAAEHAAGQHGSFLSRLHDIVEIAYEAPKVIGEIWDKVKEVGAEWVNTVGFKQRNLLGLEALLGSRDKAIEVFEDVEHAALKTGSKVADVMARTKDLLTAGFDIREIGQIRKGVADLGVVQGPERAAALAEQIADIGRNGMMTGRQLMALRHVLPMEELRRELGVSSDGMNKIFDGSKAIEAGRAVSAILKVIRDNFSGGILGSLAAKDASSLDKLVARVKMLPELMTSALMGFDSSGAKIAGSILENIVGVFDPQGPSGQRMLATVRGLVDSIGVAFGLSGNGGLFAELSGPNGPKRIEEIFKNAVEWVKRDAVPAMRDLGEAIGFIAKGLHGVVHPLDTTTGLAGAVGWSLRRSAGFRDDIEPGAMVEKVRRAQQALADPNASPAAKAYARQFVYQGDINVVVQGNATKEDADHIGKTVADQVRLTADGLMSAHEQFAIQQGAY